MRGLVWITVVAIFATPAFVAGQIRCPLRDFSGLAVSARKAVVLIPVAIFSVLLLLGYARELYPMYQMMDDPGTVFLREPYVGLYRLANDKPWDWSPFLVADGPGEGTRVVYCFPSWPLASIAVAVLVYSPFAIFRRRPYAAPQPTAAPPPRSNEHESSNTNAAGHIPLQWLSLTQAEAMRARRRTLAALAALTLLWPASALAKRRAPSPVPPVVSQGVEYRAPLDVDHMGRVQAFDVASGRKLWETKVYRVRIAPLLEEDVQWVFISGTQVQGGKLLVTNERGKSFRLDLKTGRIEGAMRYWLPWFLVAVFLVAVAFFARIRTGYSRQSAAANGEPAKPPGNSGTTEEPPSVT